MKKYLSLVTFAHTIFAMPFAFIGFFLAVTTTQYHFDWLKLVLMVLCMVFARNSAMAFNRYLDRDIDIQNPRTKQRDIPAGRISPKAALTFVIINCLLFITATWFINRLCFFLSPVALFVVMGYSATKRFTALCHLVLGLGLSLAPIGAYLVVTGQFALTPIFFSLSVLCWVSGFDIIYALQDEDFDRSQNLHSIPAYLGKVNALRLSTFLHVLSAVFIMMPAFETQVGFLYYIGIAFFCAMLVYQHLLVKPNDLSRVNFAFMTTNGIASVVFAVLFLLDRIWIH
ncbi:4-hydroxybenzoate octaprenyltransferase [Mucilaginibacter rubeus]|uniref:4-hydroxybenzoate polyprenyltransferase n=1 Tax=Mucilaginibacter rubeus TaxID=2027860 RepID=A0AAE6MJN4_9SPHI|nr:MULTISPECIES: UbiA-like polyprenyltransferase [Mucilaginibacter]QEM05407.1 4-hydroxybenzoate octaprenyltransferase [Mucilaginibacter rubeus]QEM17993.1 4-hydroxybenzoate octaprenyltransferase [Mucilaginibacter gossypii]QTE37054.1 UbiA-like polyprenyltransferase [Mucilaginibacter gossypii]QTE45472.1 UbiA family prenyltransferase [Mucilaginibacter rubeus]QTE52069.1 UbiA family prenyltransferase [Mucilaginibacter rubeus]